MVEKFSDGPRGDPRGCGRGGSQAGSCHADGKGPVLCCGSLGSFSSILLFFFLVLNLSCPAVYWGISIETQKSLKQHFCTVAGSGIFFVTKETVR